MHSLTVATWLALTSPVSSTDAHTGNQSPTPCSVADYRAFDFWLGRWTVMGGPKGDQLQGHSRIERSTDGCRIIEHWSGAGGTAGMSLNAWDRQHQVWRQFWVGGDGVVLRLEGGLVDGAMVLAGELPAVGGSGKQLQRITWSRAAAGRVEQKWETSDDAGESWQISFLGIYLPEAPASPAP